MRMGGWFSQAEEAACAKARRMEHQSVLSVICTFSKQKLSGSGRQFHFEKGLHRSTMVEGYGG
jgi:hypothetical protein